jgi:hypothetical protein
MATLVGPCFPRVRSENIARPAEAAFACLSRGSAAAGSAGPLLSDPSSRSSCVTFSSTSKNSGSAMSSARSDMLSGRSGSASMAATRFLNSSPAARPATFGVE